MLSRTQLISVLVLGLGAALLVIGSVLPRITDQQPRVPLDLPDTTFVMESDSAVTSRIGEDGFREEVEGPVRRQFHAEVIEPSDKGTMSLRVGASMTRPGEEQSGNVLDGLVQAQTWTFTVDRLTGLPTGPARLLDQPMGVPVEVEMGGNWVKFPADTQEETYPAFEDALRQSVDAEFTGSQERDGHRLLSFRQTVEDVNVAELYGALYTSAQFPGEGDEAVEGDLMYSATRDWLIEPESGMIVNIAEDIDARWESEDGERLGTALLFEGEMTQANQDDLLEQALEVGDVTNVRPLGIALAAIGAILTAAGLFGALRPAREPRG